MRLSDGAIKNDPATQDRTHFARGLAAGHARVDVAERHEAIAEVRRELGGAMEALRGERAVVVVDLRHIVDMVLLRVAIFLVAAVVLAPLVAHVYARVWPRRRRDSQT